MLLKDIVGKCKDKPLFEVSFLDKMKGTITTDICLKFGLPHSRWYPRNECNLAREILFPLLKSSYDHNQIHYYTRACSHNVKV